MRHFWNRVVRPVLDAVAPAAIVEIGAAQGRNTRLLAAYCREHEATLHVIDPVPRFDVDEMVADGNVTVHAELSLNVLPNLPAVDVALVDGDHNWYTVFNELKVLQRVAREADRPTPVILCHDVAWPYARRDLYYDPDTIPPQFRHPWARMGIVRGQSQLSAGEGKNARLPNAKHEGGPRNGVLTAIEDFLAEAAEPIALRVLEEQHGLGILVPEARSELHPDLDDVVERTVAAARTPGRRPRKRGGEQVIPRVIHRVWLGPDPLPGAFEQLGASWTSSHPHWEVRLWREETLPPLRRADALERLAEDPGPDALQIRSELVRIELLRQLGGVVVDADVEAVRPLDPLLAGISAFVAVADRAGAIGCDVFGGVPEHPFFERAVERLADAVISDAGESCASVLTSMLAERPQGVTVYPRETFHSPLTLEPPKRPDDFPEIFAVHHGHREQDLRSAQLEIEQLYTDVLDLRRRLEQAQASARRARRRSEGRRRRKAAQPGEGAEATVRGDGSSASPKARRRSARSKSSG